MYGTAAETCWGNLMSKIKAYNNLEHLVVILHLKIQKCSVQLSRSKSIILYVLSDAYIPR
jgi:hypothetical protein